MDIIGNIFELEDLSQDTKEINIIYRNKTYKFTTTIPTSKDLANYQKQSTVKGITDPQKFNRLVIAHHVVEPDISNKTITEQGYLNTDDFINVKLPAVMIATLSSEICGANDVELNLNEMVKQAKN
jgi:hypothetical protein